MANIVHHKGPLAEGETHILLARILAVTVVPLFPPQPTSITLQSRSESRIVRA